MPTARCPRCATGVSYAAGSQPVCPACGYGRRSTAPAPAPPAHGAPRRTAHAKRRPSQGVAIAALLLNVLVWPGLGSLIAGRQVGWAQGSLFLLGFIPVFLVETSSVVPGTLLLLALGGAMLMFGMWVWSIGTGVDLIRRAPSSQQALATA